MIAVPHIPRSLGRDVQQQAGVLLLTFNTVVAPGQRIIKVVGDAFVELFVLFIGDFRLVTSPQRLRFVDFLPGDNGFAVFLSRFSISTGSAIWSEYLLMMERTRQSSRTRLRLHADAG